MALSESKRKEIIKLFSAKTGKKIRVHEKKDAAMLGGIRVKMDDTVYDGSVTHLLSRLSKKLKN
jgi:F-type H+-transporting ATPase subunit delta